MKLTLGSANLPRMARAAGAGRVSIQSMEIFSVRVNARGNWLFVRLRAGRSLAGLGEASHGFRFDAASDPDDRRMRRALEELFPLIRGRSPFDVEAFRSNAWSKARERGLPWVTAFSTLEQAQWDLSGKALGAPVYDLLGGKLRERLAVYANINRATNRRTPEEFAENAARAVSEGFRAIKVAPFDDFPPLTAPPGDLERMADLGIRRIEAIRKAIGPKISLLIDCHSHFDSPLAIEIARRLEPFDLYWYEEPVPPARVEETLRIKSGIKQRLAGGEHLSGREAFEPICRRRSMDIIMPDVKHCGGILEGKKIAAMAEPLEIQVSPHNPSGPVATAASAQLCAGLPNFLILEHAWGEVAWRRELTDPPEHFTGGMLQLSDRPGLGIELNDRAVREHA